MKPYIIGLTGGIACGKSAVSAILSERGAFTVDADIVSREVVKPHTEGFNSLKRQFPSAIVDGKLDRRALKNIVFNDEKQLQKLNEIMFPLIRRETQKQLEECGKDVAVLVAPLLFESGFDDMANVVVTVSADANTRIARLIERDNITTEMAINILSTQMTDAEREARSDVVIRNDASMKDLRDRVSVVYNEILERMA